MMTLPPSLMVRHYLEAELSGFLTGWRVEIGGRLEKPSKLIVITDSGKTKRWRAASGVQDDFEVVIEVRASKYHEAYEMAARIENAMDSIQNWKYPDVLRYGIDATIAIARRSRGIFALGKDEEGRWLFNLEYSLTMAYVG